MKPIDLFTPSFRFLIMGLLTFLRRKSNNNINEKNKPDYLKTLEKYVGQEIEVHYLNCSIPKIERAVLKHKPNKDSFFIGNEIGGNLISFDLTDAYGKKHAVRLIKDENGNEIYRNDNIPFDYKEKNPNP